jgi:glycosyltransferase involved in cell wall biosynthesis
VVRVAIFSRHYSEYCLRYASALAQFAEVLLVLDRSDMERQQLQYFAMPRNVRLLALDLSVKRCGGRDLVAAVDHMRRFQPDVAHYQEVPDPITPLVMAVVRPYARATVLTVHDPMAHSGSDSHLPRVSTLLRAFGRTIASGLVVHGESCRKLLRESNARHGAKSIVSQHGVLALPGVVVRASVREQDLDAQGRAEPTTFLFFGRMEAYKGLDTLLEAVRILEASGQYYRFIIAGRGDSLTRLEPQLRRHRSFEVHNRYISPDEVADLFRSAQAILLPYHDATQSGVAAASYGNARPVIASDVGGLADIVRDHQNGLLVPPRDAYALASAIRKLVDDPGLSASLRAGARETACTTLSWAHIAHELYAQFERLLQPQSC